MILLLGGIYKNKTNEQTNKNKNKVIDTEISGYKKGRGQEIGPKGEEGRLLG